jgi:TPR repeat protein
MLKHTVFSLLLLVTNAAASDVKSSSPLADEQNANEWASLEKAKASRQQWLQYEKDYRENKEGARARFEKDFIVKGSPYSFECDIGTLLGIKFSEYQERTPLEAHPFNNFKKTQLLIATHHSKSSILQRPYLNQLIFQKISTLDAKKPRVQYLLSKCYTSAIGCTKDDEKGFVHCMIAALGGDIPAQVIVMFRYLKGTKHQQKNLELAFHLAQKLIEEHSNVAAHRVVGDIYNEKKSDKNYSKLAFKHYRIAAEQGSAKAQFKIGERYCSGIGVLQNMDLGIQWLKLAKANGSKAAQVMLKTLEINTPSYQPLLSQAAVSALAPLASSPMPSTQTITQSSLPASSSPIQLAKTMNNQPLHSENLGGIMGGRFDYLYSPMDGFFGNFGGTMGGMSGNLGGTMSSNVGGVMGGITGYPGGTSAPGIPSPIPVTDPPLMGQFPQNNLIHGSLASNPTSSTNLPLAFGLESRTNPNISPGNIPLFNQPWGQSLYQPGLISYPVQAGASISPDMNKRQRDESLQNTQAERDAKRHRPNENLDVRVQKDINDINATIIEELKALRERCNALEKQNASSSQQKPQDKSDENQGQPQE